MLNFMIQQLFKDYNLGQCSKILITILFVILGKTSYSQDDIAFSEVLPASPEASSLGKFGNTPINLSTGAISLSIPIHSIEVGKYQLPIKLDYRYNGLLMDEIPGILGLGWNLSAGGMITRQVRGRPDEATLGYLGGNIGLNYVVRPYNELTLTERNYLEEKSSTNEIDTQPDKFILSIGEISATFYFDENKNIMVSPYKPYIIELINSNDFSLGFKVIDDSGVVYYFQNEEHTYPYNNESSVPNAIVDYISSWKITKIIYPNGEGIDFFYSGYTYRQKVSYESYSLVVDYQMGNNSSGENNQDIFHTVHDEKSIGSLQLDSIQYPKGKLVFDRTSQTPETANEYLSRLDSIIIKDLNNKTIDTYGFTYDFNNKTRKLLRKLEITGPEKFYEFEYNGIPEDDIPYYHQDFWGYVNSNDSGKLLNIQDFFAPRKPSFENAVIGSLAKVVYPTKGTTEYIYEANTYDPGNENLDDFYVDSGVCAELTESMSVEIATQAGSFDGAVSDIKTFTVSEDIYMTLRLEIFKNAWPGGEIYAGLRRLEDSSGGGVECSDSSLSTCEDCTGMEIYYDDGNTPEDASYQEVDKTYNSEKQLKLKPGTYELYVTAVPFPTSCGPCGVLSGYARIDMSNGEDQAIVRSRETGGIRISKIMDCPDPSVNNCITKEFIYESPEGISNGHLFRRRNLFKDEYSKSVLVYIDPQTGQTSSDFIRYNRYSSTSNLPLSGYLGSHLIYSPVIERYVNQNSETNGSKISTYSFFPSNQESDPDVRTLDVDEKEFRNGKLLREQYLTKEGVEIKTVNYLYSFNKDLNLDQRVISYKSSLSYESIYGGQNLYAHDFATFSNEFDVEELIRTEELSYFGIDTLKVIKNWTYTTPLGHSKTFELINSDGESLKTQFLYPYNENEIFDLHPTASNTIGNLISRNRISAPIQTDNYRNGLLISTRRVNYGDWGLNSIGTDNIIEQQSIESSKYGGDLDSKLIYHFYDSKGNPTEVSKTDGVHIVYVWGYNGEYLIAEIVNATYTSGKVNTITSVQQTLIDNAVEATLDEISEITENNLSTTLTLLQEGFPNSMVTTYTYDPLVGVSRITDPRGNTTYYEYDEMNRLSKVKNADGKLLVDNEYNFKGQ